MAEHDSGDLDSDLRLRLSQAMLNQSLRPVADAKKETLIEGDRGVEEGELERTAVIGEEEQRAAHELDLARGGVGLPRRMSGAQEWVLLPLSDAPEGVIGFGGEGIVYSYVQRELGREVAVKTLRADRWSYEAIESLLREACVTARLEHPNIVPVHCLHLPEHDGDSPYWAMKWVRGKPLTEHLPSGKEPWPIDELLEVFRRVLDAVAFAHSKGIVHRDLKPDNVLVGEFGEVQVTDWGLAVAINEEGARGAAPILGDDCQESEEGASGAEEGRALTEDLARLNADVRSGRVGALLNTSAGGRSGTPAYMAPEQLDITAGSITERTDVFLLGGILYAMLTGQPPHQLDEGDDTDAARRRLAQIRSCSAIPPVIDVRREHGLSETPDGLSEASLASLWDITRKALAPEPADRFESAATLETALDEWESRSASQELSTQALARLGEVTSHRRPSARGYAEVIALADASLGKWEANDEARRIRDEASSALTAIQRRSSRRFWTAAGALLLVFVVGSIGYQRTGSQRDRADLERDNALREAYFANIALAEQKIRDAHVGDAERLLDACPEQLRSWEWGWLKRLCHLELLTLRGHGSYVRSVAFSPDGQRIASGSRDKTVKVWDADTGAEVMTLKGHSAWVCAVAFSPDARRIASGSGDSTIKIWDLEARREVATLKGHADMVSGLAFSPNGKWIASASWDKTVKVWDTGTGRELATFKGTSNTTRESVRFLPWFLPGARVPRPGRPDRPGPSLPDYSVVFSPDGRRIASGGDTSVKVWDAKTGREVVRLDGHRDDVTSVAFSPDGEWIASGSVDRTVRVWDAETGREAMSLGAHHDHVMSVAFSLDGKWIASGGADRAVRVWDAETGREAMSLRGHRHYVRSVAFSPDGRRIASGSVDKTVKVWGMAAGSEARALEGHRQRVESVAFSPDGKWIASGGADKAVRVWDAETGREAMSLRGHGHYVTSVAFSPDGQRIASGSWGTTVKIWDVAAGSELMTLKHREPVRSVAFSPDGKRIASGGYPRPVRVWDARTGREVTSLEGYGPVVFSPDGKRIASGSLLRTVKVWDAETGREVVTLTEPSRAVYSVAFSPDGKQIVSASYEATKVWDAVTARGISTLAGHSSPAMSVAFSPDGRRIASGSWDKTVKVWDVATGHGVMTLRGHRAPVLSVAFSADGERIASGGWDKTVKVWDATIPLDAAEVLLGVPKGEARALFCLALMKEREHKDAEARQLHVRAAVVRDSGQKEWAEKSRWRLEHMPWLKADQTK